jgi:hypothetical protein
MKQTQSRTKFQTPHEAKATMPSAKTPAKQPTKKPTKLRKGKLGELLGHSVVSVIRAMGKAGWDYDTARAALDKAGIEAAQHTVKVGMKRGRDGQKRIAPLSAKELESLRAGKPTAKKSVKTPVHAA